ILVVLQLDGGNDGLNTIVPVEDDEYRRVRPTLGVDAKSTLALGAGYGLHPNLRGLASLWERDRLAIVQSVGYPNPNRSHFRSTEIWHAGHFDPLPDSGWLGRALEQPGASDHPASGIAIADSRPLILDNHSLLGVTLRDPAAFRQPTWSLDPESAGDPEKLQEFLRRVESRARISAETVQEVLGRGRNSLPYPETQLGNELSLVARFIAGRAPTRVYYLTQTGYDTHARQQTKHEELLQELGDALVAFVDDLERNGDLDRVVLFAFSEFGRRVAENGSLGTDHGVAGPCFVVGSRVRAGLHGQAPSLAPETLLAGDVAPTTDFRSLYGELLDRWLGVPSRDVLGSAFPSLGVLG
ncbi:MAG: DUF1501 domain-containing protein, partial [Gemmatimonadetes bacterium]|nr:DUF1501 domain-containing protein [Gemmatimonadota bacterium]